MSSLDYHNHDSPDESQRSDESKLSQLKKLLFGDEQASIADLSARVSDVEENRALLHALRKRLVEMESEFVSPDELAEKISELKLDAEELSRLLPVAVRKGSTRDKQLSNALSPTLASAFQESVQRNPKALADAVSPIMGPAIRRSISQAIAGMVQSLNQTLEHSFSARGLKWRWEALTTGKPFAEVVLLHSLIYRVEHVFLIRGEDGIVLAHVSSSPEDQTDPDMVSGMLTALQDFVRDSLGGKQSDELEDIRVGDRNIFIEHGSDAIIAAVIHGHPPESIRKTLREMSESVHIKYADELDDFDGDTDVFVPVEYELRDCLQSAYHEQETKHPSSRWWPRFKWGLAALLILAAFTWLGLYLRRHSLQREYAQLLATPDAVALELRRGVLSLRGDAHNDWITTATAAALALHHVDRVDTSELANIDQPWLDCLTALRDESGIIVTSASRKASIYYVEGLHDPLAKSAEIIISQHGLEPGQVRTRFTPFHSMEPEFVSARAWARVRQALGEIETVRWTEENGLLKATGTAPHGWCEVARGFAEHTSEVRIDVSEVEDLDRLGLLRLKETVEERVILHADSKSQLAEGQDGLLDEIASEINQLMDAAAAINVTVHVVVLGFADEEEGLESLPQSLSESRARFIWKELTNREVPPEQLLIRARGTGQITPGEAEASATDMRRCMFNVRLGP